MRKADPWAHRRAEPRTLVLLWTIYLMGAAATTVFSVGVIGMPQRSMFEPAARSMLALAGLGLGALWPMVRLSQSRPRAPRTAILTDVFALTIPLQAVIWPVRLLTGWGWDVLAGIALGLFSWALLVGAVLAAGLVRTPAPVEGRDIEVSARFSGARTTWMLIALLMSAGGPAALLIGGYLGITPPAFGWLLSPITLTHALTSARSGLSPVMAPEEWLACLGPGVLGLLVWSGLAATAWAAAKSRRDNPRAGS